MATPCPKPEKRQPKSKRPIPHVSAKRRKAESEKQAAYKVVTKRYCQGCGTSQNLSRSHTLPVSRNLEAIGDPRNIFVLCMAGCHEICESSRFWLLDCGEELVRNMLEIDYLAGLQRIEKMRQRLMESETNPDDCPEWVSEILKLIECQI